MLARRRGGNHYNHYRGGQIDCYVRVLCLPYARTALKGRVASRRLYSTFGCTASALPGGAAAPRHSVLNRLHCARRFHDHHHMVNKGNFGSGLDFFDVLAGTRTYAEE